MLVLSMHLDEAATLYTHDGQEIGKVMVVDRSGSKLRVAFDMNDNIAIARPGVSKEIAMAIHQKKKVEHGKD